LRQNRVRALQKKPRLGVLPAACACMLFLSACANEGIWPNDPLPPAPAGDPPPAPSFISPNIGSDEERRVLTNIEREEVEERLSKIAKSRAVAAPKRSQKAK
jgi:hypothetical protein